MLVNAISKMVSMLSVKYATLEQHYSVGSTAVTLAYITPYHWYLGHDEVSAGGSTIPVAIWALIFRGTRTSCSLEAERPPASPLRAPPLGVTPSFSYLFSELYTMCHKQFAKWPGSNFIHVYETVKNSYSAFL